MVYEFNGFKPFIHKSSFIHPQSAVTGNVSIGKNCYIGPGAAIRGDWGEIIIEDGCNVQENCTIHMFPGVTVLLKKGTHMGHGSIVHGSTVGRNCLIGMNAVVMDNVVLGDECIVGALSFVKDGSVFTRRSLIAGSPAVLIRKVSAEMVAWKTKGTAIYQQLPADCYATLKACEPLRKKEHRKSTQAKTYKTWKQS
ncbi:MAG: transferase hexapeptide repeat family protein [Pedobacter sp.]|nr:MAG: transferase hexapeptide repeat family protein [Pedobacter sp.]